MQNTSTLLFLNLQLFADGAAAAPAGEAGGQQAETSALPKAETQQTGRSRRSKSGAYDNVVFGKQEDAPAEETNGSAAGGDGEGNASGVTTTSDTLEAKRKAFDEMIDGEYRDIYQEKFQQAFNRRFKETKGMEEALNAQKPILDLLMQKYQIADGDMSKLQSAIEEDNTFFEDAAEQAGLTVEQYKAMQKLERENEQLRQMRQRQQGQQQMQQQLNKWYQEAETLKQDYPGFDFKYEAQNREFLGLLRSGIPVKQAYELIHMDEIKQAAARSAAQATSQQMTAKMKSKASRPTENGTSSQSAAIVKSDVGSLSRADRAEIARRVARGEQIKF